MIKTLGFQSPRKTDIPDKPAPGQKPIVDIEDVWVCYDGKWVLKSIYLKCFEGEILGIVGPNGGGKSTLLKVILGLIEPLKGKVLLFGQKPDKKSRLNVGYLPQLSKAEQSFPVTALDVVLMGLCQQMKLFSRFGKKQKALALQKLDRVGMADHAAKPFGTLSGGQQQRVHIARALASEPSLLVLDEPSTGIDSVGQEDFYILLANLRDSQNISAIMVSHDIGMITSHTNRVACLNRHIHYHDDTDPSLESDDHHKIFGKDLKVMVHDPRCVSCMMRHKDDD